MEIAEASSNMGSSSSAAAAAPAVVVVYLHDTICMKDKELWYRVELPVTTNGNKLLLLSKRKRLTPLNIYPVAEMYMPSYGYAGNWDVIGDDIYWIGGFYRSLRNYGPLSLRKHLYKHNMNHSDPTSWKEVSSSMNIRRISPFVAAVGVGEKKQQLCVVSGSAYQSQSQNDTYDSSIWKQCGEIYDIKKKTWKLIDVDYKDVSRYNTENQIAQDVDNPTEIVFYSLGRGSMVVLDVAKGCISKGPICPAEFDLWMQSLPPKGLVDRADVTMLQLVTSNVGAVLADGTFYWCTHVHFRLYGYDTKRERWLRSPSLKNHLPPIVFDNERPQYPLLLGLGNGKFVLVVAVDPGYCTMALLTVDKRENSLAVSVDRLQDVYFDDHDFLPNEGKAM
ncbi:hypothetical protein HAX54_005620 [Datura stramonium]|uniref:Uncharacterized protein n=1 Tax=Datura stramonium TaxID=4076 RepID=A0ABS8T926_DATST|nr:hypothetical protein [Datura stramonium]